MIRIKNRLFSEENAVSPVIGVMLMIVVTVILAAAVSAFSGSVGLKDTPTQAVFDVSCSASDGKIVIKHMGGDTIYKEDIKLEVSHGMPRMTDYLSTGNLTFYPADQNTRDAGMDKLPLEPGQIAEYNFDSKWVEYDPDPDNYFTPDIDEPNVTAYSPILGEQMVEIGETFTFSIIDAATENTIFTTDVLMEA